MISQKKGAREIIPRLKKTLGDYARGESGKISKQSMLTVGAIVGGAAIGAAIASKSAKGAGARLISRALHKNVVTLRDQGGMGSNDALTLNYTSSGALIVTHDHTTTTSTSY